MMNDTITKSSCYVKRLLSAAAFILLAQQGYSQQVKPTPQPDLETDRPDQTEAASVVPARSIQLEAGLYFLKDKIGNATLNYTAYPTALVRFGILDWLEMRAEGTYQRLVVEDEIRTRANGFGPLTVGTKVQLWKENGFRPQAAAMAMVDLPVGHKAFKPEDPQLGLRLMFRNSLTEKTDLNYNLAYGWEDGEPVIGYAVSIGRSLNDKMTVYGEVFGDKPNGSKAEHSFDTGLLFLISPTLQVDIAAGTALNLQAPDYFITTGFSLRLPK
ncbi:transporter [Pontibacter pudoricolor]|uniref:transporter n=1 Tax=Pontibacter pudoricolor TaxID=2694930 RepID=UPI0013914A63|nr:transporter [Pontibacter pudoricolor]